MNLSELIDFYPPWNHQKTYGFLMISGGIKVNWFAEIHLIVEATFGDEPLPEPVRSKQGIECNKRSISYHNDLN